MKKNRLYVSAFMGILLFLTFVYVGINYKDSSDYETGKEWDEGVWGDFLILSSDHNLRHKSPEAVIFNDTLFFFYHIISKDTYNEDDVIMPHEYRLYNIVYRTFDGESWSQEYNLSNIHDEISSSFFSIVPFNNSLILFYTESWINNYTTYDWSKRISAIQFDGLHWQNFTSPFNHENNSFLETVYYPSVLSMDHLFFFWKSIPYSEQNKPFCKLKEYAYKYYNGTTWSEQFNLTFPTATSNVKFRAIDDEIWAVWEDWTVGHNTEDIYMARLDNTTWYEVNMMTLPDDFNINFRPDIIKFQDKLFVAWESDSIVMRSYSNSNLGELLRVSTGGVQAYLVTYNDKLYVVWHTCDSNHLVRSYDGSNFSNIYKITDKTHKGADYPKASEYQGKLYFYWTTIDNDTVKIIIRPYERG